MPNIDLTPYPGAAEFRKELGERSIAHEISGDPVCACFLARDEQGREAELHFFSDRLIADGLHWYAAEDRPGEWKRVLQYSRWEFDGTYAGLPEWLRKRLEARNASA